MSMEFAASQLYGRWQLKRMPVAYRLYLDAIHDGLCPDRGAGINGMIAWKWYRKQGYPKAVDSVRPEDARPAGTMCG